MSLFSWFKRKDPRNNHSFNDDERELAAVKRKLNAERRELEHKIDMEKRKRELEEIQMELEEMRAERNGYDDDQEGPAPATGEAIFMNALMQKVMGGGVPGAGAPGGLVNSPGPVQEAIPLPELSDQEIDGLIAEFVPKRYKLAAKILSEENLKRIILNMDEYGMITDDTANKIARRLKE